MLMKKNQDGFSIIESLLVLVIIGLVGFVGWYVWNSKTNTDKVLSVNNSGSPRFKKKANAKVAAGGSQKTVDPTKDWVPYASSSHKFTLKYPQNWAVAANPELCGPDTLLLGPTPEAVGKCATEGTGEVLFSFSDRYACQPLDSASYEGLKGELAFLYGIAGSKQTGVSKDTSTEGDGGLPAGVKVIHYCFDDGNKHFTAFYRQLPSYPDVSADFNTIVTNTLKLN